MLGFCRDRVLIQTQTERLEQSIAVEATNGAPSPGDGVNDTEVNSFIESRRKISGLFGFIVPENYPVL